MKMNFGKRFISMLLVMAFVMALLPMGVFAAEQANDSSARLIDGNRKVDPSTMDDWKEYFPITGELSSENAGGVWMDKSVLLNDSAFEGMGIEMDRDDSFLAVLSAIASNSTITGLSHVPTDSMLVLDLSGSMSQNGMADDLVAAANESIAALLQTNQYNRVGVVVYSGTRSSSTNSDAAILLLPMGRYSTGSDGKYLKYSNNSVGIDNDLTYENSTDKPKSQSKSVSGATYIQKGIIFAMEQFVAATNSTTVEDTLVGTLNRKPVVVLMSDGAPTLGTTNFTNPGQYSLGDGTNTSAAIGFVTQLTISYAKAKIEEKYGKDSCLLYTLGLGVTNDSIARSVLDPSTSNGSSAINNFWASYNSQNLKVGDKLTVSSSNFGYNTQSVTKIEIPLEHHYVDKYFAADGNSSQLAAQLKQAFKDIVGNIQLQSGYYPTLIHQNEDLSGYVSFVDRVGQYMEVVDIKGILIHDTLFSGADLASNFGNDAESLLGTFEEPTQMALDMISAICARLGVDADTAATLVQLAYENGQLSYTDRDHYSNYIGWYANANGEFLGFYHEGVTTLPESTGNVDTDPKFVVKSYGYLGEVDESHGVTKSDMMYATVQVREDIESGEQIVAFAIPAALIPIVTYNITLNEDKSLSDLSVSGATSPIRLVYEIGLRTDINSYNITEMLSDTYLSDPHNVNSDGSVNFYTNQWDHENKAGYGTVNTYGYFNPSRQNDRYYYLEDSPIYSDMNGKLYSGSQKPSGDMYSAYTVYKKDGETLQTETVYRKISEAEAETAIRGENGTWYIPMGNVHVDMNGNAVHKTQNITETLSEANVSFVDTQNHNVNDTGYRFYVGSTLGNNGKLTLTPETGIKLSKRMAEDASVPTSAFTFRLTNLTDAEDLTSYPAWRIGADGRTEHTAAKFTDGVAEVQLMAGDVLYIGGMADQTVVQIEEVETASYIAASEGLSEQGTVTVFKNRIANVSFVNSDRGAGNLSIYKEVNHDYGAEYQIPSDKIFVMEVTLKGIGTAKATFRASHSNGNYSEITTDENGKFTVALKNNEEFEVFGLPVGTVATVVETEYGKGFTPIYLDNGVAGDGVVTVVRDATVAVIVVNDYTAKEVYPVNVEVVGNKTLEGRDWNDSDEFTFVLQKYMADGSWQQLGNEAVVTKAHTSFAFDGAFANESYSAAGVYYYRVIEIEPDAPIGGISYDKTVHSFYIVVGDTDMDGSLEITDVRTDREDRIRILNRENVWTVETTFENIYTVSGSATVTVDVNKHIENRGGATQSPAGFRFGLFDAATGDQIGNVLSTTERGFARFVLTYGAEDAGKTYTYILKEIVPAAVANGWTYSTEEYSVTVQVTDTQNGSITATVQIGSEQPSVAASVDFTNVYDPTDATLAVDFVKKQLTGRAMTEGEFSFELRNADSGEAVLTGTNDANGNVVFDGDLTYDKVGTYHYSITETTVDKNGILCDKTVYLMAVYVSDVGGRLTAQYVFANAVGNTVTFHNTYTAAPVQNSVRGTKVLRGRVLLNDEFSFVLTELTVDGKAVQNPTKWNTKNFASGAFAFPAISYQKAGVYEYSIEEVRPASNKVYGVTYDTAVYKVKVTVKDDGVGKLYIDSQTVTYLDGTAANAVVFVNEYIPTSAVSQITGTKQLVGKVNNTLLGGEFTFELYEADADWTYGEDDLIESVQNKENGHIEFSELDFSTDADKYYVVVEKNGGMTIDGITYDQSEYRVHMDVYDSLKGSLMVTENIYQVLEIDGVLTSIPVDTILFVNRYEVTGSETVVLSGEKRLEGRELKDTDTFRFELYEADSNFISFGDALYSAEMDPASRRYRLELTYTAEDVGNIYYYLLQEENAGMTIEGVTYSSTVYRIVVSVEDDGVGGIRTVVTLKDSLADTLDFVNVYKAEAVGESFEATKELLGMTMEDGQFFFDLHASDANGEKGELLQSVSNQNGKIHFEEIVFTEAGDYYYLISEQNGGKTVNGITYDASVYRVHVKVTDHLDGTMSTSVTLTDMQGDPAAKIAFVNEYKAGSASIGLEGTKILVGRELTEGEFRFVLYRADSNFKVHSEANGQIAYNNADGSFRFDTIQAQAAGTYYFVIVEDGEVEADRVTFDSTVYNVSVTVTDDGKGNLVAGAPAIMKVNGIEWDEWIVFTNVYTPKPEDMEVGITVNKTVRNIGSESITAEGFQFLVTDFANEWTMIADEAGLAQMMFRYSEADIGKTFTYKIVEINDQRENVVYSELEYVLSVTVALDEQTNQLVASYTVNGEAVEEITVAFENVYDYTPAAQTGDMAMMSVFGAAIAAVGLAFVWTSKKRGRMRG